MKSALLLAATAVITVANVGFASAAEPASPDPHGFDVAGVKLEMTVEEAEAALKTYDATLELMVQDAPSPDGATDLFLHAWKTDTRYPRKYSEEVAVAFTRSTPHRAFAIFRDLGLPPEQEESFPDVEKRITETYGPTAKVAGGFHDWVFDAAGAPIDGAPSPTTAETSDKFVACWHSVFESTTSLFRFNFGTMAANGLPVSYHPDCGISLRVIVQRYDRDHPDAVQEIVERLMSDPLAVADGRSTQPVEGPEALLRRINPHGPDVPSAKSTEGSGQL